MKVLIFDIGGTALKYTVMSNGKMEFEPKYISTRDKDKDFVIKEIKRIYGEFENDIAGIAVSTPGAILENGYVNGLTAIPGWTYFSLADEFKSIGITKPWTAINDGNAALYAEYAANKSFKNVANLAIGTGMGGGIIVNGQLIIGKDGFGAEMGYLMSAPFAHDKDDIRSFVCGSETSGFLSLENKYEEATGTRLSGKEIFEKYDEGNDEVANKLVTNFYGGISNIIWTLVFTLNLDIVYISGGITNRKEAINEIKDSFLSLLDKKNFPIKDVVEIKEAKYKQEAGIIGAYEYFIDSTKGNK